ncbi:MAG: PfkB family carbohydrate kinase [Phycisphaerales bacterium]
MGSVNGESGGSGKVLGRDGLRAAREAARAGGRTVVHCHGCFDIVHPGHIRHLRFAKAQGDVLLVSITGDGHIQKGDGRPLIPQELRAENLAALDFVDWVHVAPEPTALGVLEVVRPDVYVKGREYEQNHDPRFMAERECVERHGGRVVFSSGDVVFSSTALIEAIEQDIDPFHGRLRALLDDPELSAARLDDQIGSFRGKRVVVLGEAILDTYVFCDRPDVAGESPVLTLRPREARHYDGGAAVAARHLAAMGASPILVTALPESDRGEEMRRRLISEGIDVRTVRTATALPEKQRFLVGAQKVMKLDLVDPVVLDAHAQDELVDLAVGAASEIHTDASIVLDFGLGLLSPALLRRALVGLRDKSAIMAGDVSGRRSSLREMRGMDLVCPSESELRDAFGNYGDGLPAVTWKLLETTGTSAAIVTMGPEGLIGFSRLPEPARAGGGWATRLRGEHVPALSAHAVDALGCGDAMITAATLTLASGGSVLVASVLGAAAASVEARRLGNVPISATDLRREVRRVHSAHLAFAGADAVAALGARTGMRSAS